MHKISTMKSFHTVLNFRLIIWFQCVWPLRVSLYIYVCNGITLGWMLDLFTMCWILDQFTLYWMQDLITLCWMLELFTMCWMQDLFTLGRM